MRNEFEKKLYRQIKRKVKVKYEGEEFSYVLKKNYIPDFVIDFGDRKLYIEAKGHFRREDKEKLAAIKKQYPELDLRIVFYAKRKKNITWAERNKIPWAIEKIPKEWLE